jgi:GTP pyrophosphokinase
MIRLSQCCQPIPGDAIIGFITRGRGITVHKKSCPSLKRLSGEPERFIKIIWSDARETSYPVKIAVHATDRVNLLKDIADSLAEIKTNIYKMEAEAEPGGQAIFKFVIEVKGLDEISHIAAQLKKVKNVTEVIKVNEKVVLK